MASVACINAQLLECHGWLQDAEDAGMVHKSPYGWIAAAPPNQDGGVV